MPDTLIIIEVICFIIVIVFLFILLRDPDKKRIPILISILCLISGTGIQITREIKDDTIIYQLSIDNNNTSFVNYSEYDYFENLKVGIIFHSMQIVNKSKTTFTINDIHLEYYLNNKTERVKARFLPVEFQKTPHHEKDSPFIKLYRKKDQTLLIFQNWFNITEKLPKFLDVNEVLESSAFFILNIDYYSDLYNINEINFN